MYGVFKLPKWWLFGGFWWEEGSVLVTVVASQFEYVVGLLAKQVYTLAVSVPLGSQSLLRSATLALLPMNTMRLDT